MGLFVMALATGCASRRLQTEQLPEVPIAFLHWSDKAAQKRAEAFAKVAELPRPPVDEEFRELAQEFEIRVHLRGEVTPALRQMLEKYPGRLMLIWPRTGRVERVEAAPRDALPLAWSPDRKRLLFSSAHRGGKEQLYEYHVEREDLTPITYGPEEHPRGDYCEPGRLVVQQLDRRSGQDPAVQTVLEVGLGGRVGRTLARDVPPGPLSCSPRGDRLVYEQVRPRPRRDGPTVYESWVATWPLEREGAEKLLIKGREPVLTPDGDWIVFASPSSAGYRLRRMRPDGSSRVAISPGGAEERMPTVSPDGEFIAFIQTDGGNRRLWVRSFDGKSDRPLYREGWSEFPVW